MLIIYAEKQVEKECAIVIQDPSGNDKKINLILYNGEWLVEGEFQDERLYDWTPFPGQEV